MKKLILTTLLLSLQAQAYHPEAILGFWRNEKGIFIQVESGGCTKKEDFILSQELYDETPLFALVRVRQDNCLAMFPYGVPLHYSYIELGIMSTTNIKIINRLKVNQLDQPTGDELSQDLSSLETN